MKTNTMQCKKNTIQQKNNRNTEILCKRNTSWLTAEDQEV